MSKQHVMVYDTTLRDGTQGEGISFSAMDKILLARRMDQFGFDYIEGGWPGSNPRDMEFFDKAKEEEFQNAKLVAFGSTRRAGVEPKDDPQLQKLLDAGTPAVAIFGKTWRLHVTKVIRTTLEENLKMIRSSVQFLKSAGKEVIYDAEHFFDGFTDNEAYAMATLNAASEGGADYLVLCDTNGGTQLSAFASIINIVKSKFPKQKIGIHCHNDCGLGVALSLSGVEAGAVMIQGTMNGYGERVGNANLTSIIPNLYFKLAYPLSCSDNIDQLRQFSIEVDRLANLKPDKKAPFVGASAFAHKGGVHANAAKKVARSYEHLQPEKVGNKQRILLSDMAGSSSIVMKAKELGIRLEEKSSEMRSFLKRIKKLENEGYEFENADGSFLVLLYQHFHGLEDNFELISYRTISEVVRDTHRNISEAVVKIKVEEETDIKINVAESTGPVGALDHAMRSAFEKHYPELRSMQLLDYKVRILQTGMGTDSVVQVLMKSGDDSESWWTCGANSNIIEASWQALRDSFRFKLLKTHLQQPRILNKSKIL